MSDVQVKYGDNANAFAGKLLSAARELELDVSVVKFSPDGHFTVPEEVADQAKVSYEGLDEDADHAGEVPHEAAVSDGADQGGPADPDDAAKAEAEGDGSVVEAQGPEAPKVDEPEAPSVEAPKKSAKRDAWADYAKVVGEPGEQLDSDTKPQDEGGLNRADLIAKYGPKE